MAKKNYYAIKRGKQTNVIVSTWDECKKLVDGFPGAEYKGFITESEALEYIGAQKEIVNNNTSNESSDKELTGTICYTDGACSGNGQADGGAGGWGTIIIQNGIRTELSGGSPCTTNNRMELIACIKALEYIKTPSTVTLITDSKYVVNGIDNGWAKNWRRNSWMKSDGIPAKNPDLWDALLQAIDFHKSVKLQWVKGHASTRENNRCDEMAVQQSRNYKKK